MTLKKALILSLIVHVAFVWFYPNKQPKVKELTFQVELVKENGGKKFEKGRKKGTGKEREKNKRKRKDFDDKGKYNQIIPRSSSSGKNKCEDWFGGIGITHRHMEVVEIHEGYPAIKAGLLEGDVIIEPFPDEIRGDVNTEIKVTVSRGNRTLTFTMIRDKICVKE